MPTLLTDVVSLLGFLFSAVGFLIVGLGMGRFFQDAYPKAAWQLQIALALGFFGLLIGLVDFASPGTAGAFALGAGIAFFMDKQGKKDTDATMVDEVRIKK